MKISTTARRRGIFIEEMIKDSSPENQIRAYMKAYPDCKNKNSARTASHRLLLDVSVAKAISDGLQRLQEEKEAAAREARLELARKEVADIVELDAELSRIALGKTRRKIRRPVWNKEKQTYEIIAIEEEPSETDRIAAADKLYRRKGSYAPTTMKHQTDDSFIAFMKAVSAAGGGQ